jgi:hypothetical protein
VENKLVSEADFIELRGVFSKNDRLAPGSGAYLQSVQAALAAGRVVFDSEWHIDQTRVRVPVLQKTSEGIEATTIRNIKLYSRSTNEHDALERGLVALALEENSIPGVTVTSTRMLNSESPEGLDVASSPRFKPHRPPRKASSEKGWPS